MQSRSNMQRKKKEKGMPDKMQRFISDKTAAEIKDKLTEKATIKNLELVKNLTPDQIDTYIDSNITDLDSNKYLVRILLGPETVRGVIRLRMEIRLPAGNRCIHHLELLLHPI